MQRFVALSLALVLLITMGGPVRAQTAPTHYMLNPVAVVEVDVNNKGVAVAMRYTFRESDPTEIIQPTISLKTTPVVSQSGGSVSHSNARVDATAEAATAEASTQVCELLERAKNLTPEQLDRLGKDTGLPFSATAATAALQLGLVVGGLDMVARGATYIRTAVTAFGSAATAGQTVVVTARTLGPLLFSAGVAAATTTLVFGGLVPGVGAIAAGSLLIGVAWYIQKKKSVTTVTMTLDVPQIFGWRSPNQLVQGTSFGNFSFLYSRLQQQFLEHDTQTILVGYPLLAIPPTSTCGAYLCAQALDWITGDQVGWGPPCIWSYLNAGKTCCATIYAVPGTTVNAPYWDYPPADPDCPCWLMRGVVEDNPPLPVFYQIIP